MIYILYYKKLELLSYIFAADSMGLNSLVVTYEARSKSFATQYDAQMTQAKFLCY